MRSFHPWQRLNVLFPILGTPKIAEMLCRADLPLGMTTVERRLRNAWITHRRQPASEMGYERASSEHGKLHQGGTAL